MVAGSGVDLLTAALWRAPRSMVEVEVRSVLVAHVASGVLAQLVFHRVDPAGFRTVFAAVHHSALQLRDPATYERVREGAALLEPTEITGGFTPGRGLRWILPGDPGGRSWSAGVRLVRLVDGEPAAQRLAAHFGVSLQVSRPDA